MSKLAALISNSLEFTLERGAEFIREAGHQAQEVGQVIGEAGKEAGTAIKFDMKASLGGFQEKNQDVAKTPELLEEEQKKDSEVNRLQTHFAKLSADLEAIQKKEPEMSFDKYTLQAATMSTEERNKIQGFNLDYRREYSDTPHAMTNMRTTLMELERAKTEEPVKAAAVKPGASAINASLEGASGGLERNIELSGESPKTNLSFNAGG